MIRPMRVIVDPPLAAQFADYASYHRTRGNQLCHMAGIPLIVLTLFALLTRIPLFALGGFVVTPAELLFLAALAYYLTLDVTLALAMAVASFGLLVAGRFLPWPVAAGLFVLGWILQYVGHYTYEKRSPAFYRNVVHLLVGPLWILAKLTGRA
jgi:uncharacterized membrane protein YGL010W